MSLFGTVRSSLPEVFLEKDVLKICSKFTGEHPRRSAICKATLFKSHFGMGVLLWICCIFSEHLFLGNTPGWLLLYCKNPYSYQRILLLFRSSHRWCSVRKGVLSNFKKFTGKHLCQRLFVNKGLQTTSLLKKSPWHWCFPVNFAKFLRAPFFTEYLRWLLLKM